MALLTSDKGYFTVTDLSFTPSVVAMGETVQFSVTIQNSSGKKISSCYIEMRGTYPSTNDPLGYSEVPGDVYLHGGPNFAMASISWASGSSKTFTGSFTWKTTGHYPLDDSSYVLSPSSANIFLGIVTDVFFSDQSNHDNIFNLCGSDGEYLSILSKRDNPRVTLDIWRAPDDESSSVATTVKITSDVSSDVFESRGYSAKLYYSSSNNPPTTSDSTATLNVTIAQMLAGVTGSTSAITTAFSNGSDWYFLLVVSNGYESNSATCSIPRAFANLHLSGCTTGGVAFGKFSASTENDPKFECVYPTHLYGGIAQIGDGWTYLTPINGTTPAAFGGGALRCRKIEKMCIVDGSINVKPGSGYVAIANLPSGYTPVSSVHSLNACSGSRIARIGVSGPTETPPGQLVLHWVKNLSDGSNYTSASIWIQCSIMYWVD